MSGSRGTGGREFQHDVLDEENARGPRVTICVRGTNSMRSSVDRRRERPVAATTGTQDWDKYVGARRCRNLYVMRFSLKVTRSGKL